MDKEKLAALVCLAAAITILLLVMDDDYEVATKEQEYYCKMVKDKSWVDYKGTYSEWCEVPDKEDIISNH